MWTQQEVANRFGIKVQVVRDLMKKLGKKESGILKKRQAEVLKARQLMALNSAITQHLISKEFIWSSKQIQAQVREIAGIEVSKRAIISAFKARFKLSYRRVKRVSFSGNSEHNLVLRSLYAKKMLKLYEKRTHIVNLDESWLPEADFRRRNWDARGEPHSVPAKLMGRKVNMIVAVSSEGYVWLSLTQVNTDEDVMQLYLSKLAQVFTKQFGRDWRQQIVVLMDGASYHRSKETRNCIKHLNMRVVLSSPYSYAAAPAELFFAHMKRGDMNPDRIKSGKK